MQCKKSVETSTYFLRRKGFTQGDDNHSSIRVIVILGQTLAVFSCIDYRRTFLMQGIILERLSIK